MKNSPFLGQIGQNSGAGLVFGKHREKLDAIAELRITGDNSGRAEERASSKSPPVSPTSRDQGGAPAAGYCAGVWVAAGEGASAVTSGVRGLIFTVARICSRRLKTLSRSTCLTKPSDEASVVTFSANS